MASYQTLRSVSDNHVIVICRDGEFYSDTLELSLRAAVSGFRSLA